MATLTHPKGRSVVVPDETVDYYTSKGWSVAGEKPAKATGGSADIPEGDPSDKWSNKQLEAYAAREGIDLGTPKNKGDRLKAIADAREGKSDSASEDAGSNGE